ncbi:MAG TPA: hypothetical protein PK413_02045, partial [Thermoanaerobaculia bacterium]|nr:hypothetical protein [Thermoanaerobaculia bacterium]
MDTFLALAASDSLTRLVLFPAVAALPLVFLRREQVVKVYLLVVSLLELGLAALYLGSHGGADGPFTASR